MRFEQKLAALLILQQQSATISGWDDRHQLFYYCLEQLIELNRPAKPQRQFVKQYQRLCLIDVDWVPELEHRCCGIDHFADVEARIMGFYYGRVVGTPARIELGSRCRNGHFQRGIADPDHVTQFETELALALDGLAVNIGAIGAAEVFDPIVTVDDRDLRMRPRDT